MPWGGPALLFVRKAAEMGALRTGMREVLKAVEDGRARLVIFARDTEPVGLHTEIRNACVNEEVIFFEVPHRQELGNAALLGVSTSVCAIVATDQDQQLHHTIEEWEMILLTIWELHADLRDGNP